MAGALGLALAGATLGQVSAGYEGGRLTSAGRRVFLGVSRAVLGYALPTEPAAQQRALNAHLARLDHAIAAFPPAVRDELSRLLGLLDTTAGRLLVAGLRADWERATEQELHTALQAMRFSSISLRQQAYHALRDLTNAAFFAEPTHWASIGYPGPTPA